MELHFDFQARTINFKLYFIRLDKRGRQKPEDKQVMG